MLTVKDVAERLALSTDKVYDLVAASKIEHHRFGGTIRITEEQLAAYLESTRQPVRAPMRRASLRRVKFKHLRGWTLE
jgi:excisionase family DNA binding protein